MSRGEEKDWSALCNYVSSLENKEAHIVGHIDAETALLFAGDFAFCF